jgi:predicted nucleic acid-binding protein
VWTYFDTSALVKRYVDEPGRREVLRLLRRNECVTSAVLPIELRRGLRRRVAEGSIDAARLPAILKHVAVDRPYWTLVEVGIDVLAGAETLVAAHPIRALDAIHVASAQLFAARVSMSGLAFVSADKRQTETAVAVGLVVRHIE